MASYDGNEWHKYTPADCDLLSDFILDLAVDRVNRKWVTTNEGISVYNGTRWLSYTTKNSGLPSDIVPAVAIDKKNVKWFGTLGGLVRYDGETWKVWNTSNSPLPSDQVNDIAIDDDGLLWIGTGAGAAVFDGEKEWVVFTAKNSRLPGGNIYKVANDSRGNHWFGNDAKGLARLSGFVMPGREPSVPAEPEVAMAELERPAVQPESKPEPKQQAKDEQIRIVPFLSEGYVTIAMESATASVEFLDNSGRTIKTVSEYRNGQKIKIDKMPKGMYRVVVKTPSVTKRIKFNLK